MQLYHHPYSLDSQKVRIALEEKNIDYTSHHINPITGKNMDSSFFRKNPSAKLPVFQNGTHIIFDTIEIIQYIERIAVVSAGADETSISGKEVEHVIETIQAQIETSISADETSLKLCKHKFVLINLYIERIAVVSAGADETSISGKEVVEWMQKIQEWNPKFFTLSHIPEKYRLKVSKFIRRVVIARMAESPELASAYHCKLKEAYETEDKLKNAEVLKRSKEQLARILDEVETRLGETPYLVGEEFSMADAMLIPVLARLVLLNLEDEYISSRPNISEYWLLVQQRPSYRKVIGKYFNGWRKYKTLIKTWCFIQFRSLLRKY